MNDDDVYVTAVHSCNKDMREAFDRLTATYGCMARSAMLVTAAEFLAFNDNAGGTRAGINSFIEVYDKFLRASSGRAP